MELRPLRYGKLWITEDKLDKYGVEMFEIWKIMEIIYYRHYYRLIPSHDRNVAAALTHAVAALEISPGRGRFWGRFLGTWGSGILSTQQRWKMGFL